MLLLAGILNLYTFFVYTGTFIVPLGRFIAFFSIRLLKTFVFIIVIFLLNNCTFIILCYNLLIG